MAASIPPSQPVRGGQDRVLASRGVEQHHRATYYDVQRSDFADGEYAIVATKVPALGLVDEGLQPDSASYYLVRACNHLGCTEFDDDPVAASPSPTPT